MIDRVRKLIQQAVPGVVEEIKWRKPSNPGGVPVWSLGGIICTGETYKNAVKLTFARGAAVPDPSGLFNADLDGNTRRAIDIPAPVDSRRGGLPFDEKAFKALVQAAVALNQAKTEDGTGKGKAGRDAASRGGDSARGGGVAAKKSAGGRTAGKRSARSAIDAEILAYNTGQAAGDRRICDVLAETIHQQLPGAENKIWHRHPVWFLDGNPIAGYSKLKDCIRLLFWSGQSFDEPGLADEGSFKAAEARYTDADQISMKDLKRWLKKAIAIQWDYKNIVKRRGRLERLR